MNKADLKAAMLELCELRARADEIEKIINAPDKPEFEIGSFGEFFDHGGRRFFGYLGAIKRGYYKKHNEDGFNWNNFEPITEAILPPMIKHDGGEYRGDCQDDVLLHTSGGKTEVSRALYINWGRGGHSSIIGYQVIKRANK